MHSALKRLTGAGRTAVASAAILAGCSLPVLAQFGTIFGDPPPRPPANVPSRPPAADPRDDQFFERRQPPPRSQQQDPSGRIGPGRPPSQAIQSEPLAPPPGGIAAPEPSRQATPSPTPVPTVDVPLAVVTGYTNAPASITRAEVDAMLQAGDVLIQACEFFTAVNPVPRCLPAAEIVAHVAANPTEVAMLPAGLVESADALRALSEVE